jgi:D-alanyl-D-alanine dipeptidase
MKYFLLAIFLVSTLSFMTQASGALPMMEPAPKPTNGSANGPTNDPAVTLSIEHIGANPDFSDLTEWAGLKIDLRYATENNFLKRNLYGSFNRCYLHKVAAEKLKKALINLQAVKPEFRFLIFDCLRPLSVQKALWTAVVNTPQQKYVADPSRGSVHNYGFAIDLSIVDNDGKELDMGSAFDFFGDISEPALEAKNLKSGKLTQAQIANRTLLRAVMTRAGFLHLASEWWHFDAIPASEVRKSFKFIE